MVCWKMLALVLLLTCVSCVFSDNDFDVNKTISVLEQGETQIESWDYLDEAIFVLGITGTGKSTLIQFLSDNKKLSAVRVGGMLLFKDTDDKISDNHFISKTFYPEKIYSARAKMNLIDCPGFDDTRSGTDPTFDIATNYFIKKALSKVRRIKLVFTVAHNSVVSGNERHGFMKLLRYASTLINDVNKFKNAISLVITKVSKGDGETDDEHRKYVVNYMEEAKLYLQENISREQESLENEENPMITNMKNLIEIFSEQENGIYAKIGIFRRPDKQMSNIEHSPVLQKTKQDLQTLIFSRSQSIAASDSDFEYYMSDNSKLQLRETVLPTIRSQLQVFFEQISNILFSYYIKTIQNQNTLSEKLSQIIELKSNIKTIFEVIKVYTYEEVVVIISKLAHIPVFKDTEIIISIQHLFKQLKFINVFYDINLDYFDELGLKKVYFVTNNLQSYFESDFEDEMKLKTNADVKQCIDAVKSKLTDTFLADVNLKTSIPYLQEQLVTYRNLNQFEETANNATQILTFLSKYNPKCLPLTELSDIIEKYPQLSADNDMKINFQSYGIFTVKEVVTHLELTINTELKQRVKINLELVTLKIKENLIKQIRSKLESIKDVNLKIQFTDHEVIFVDNLFVSKDDTQNFFKNRFEILKMKVNNANLKKEISNVLENLKQYNEIGEQINLGVILSPLRRMREDIDQLTSLDLRPAVFNEVANVIETCATEMSHVIYENSKQLGVSDELDNYLQTQLDFYDKTVTETDTPTEFVSVISKLLSNLRSVGTKQNLISTVNLLKHIGFFINLDRVNRNITSEFGLQKLSDLKDDIKKIISWLRIVKESKSLVSSIDQVVKYNTLNGTDLENMFDSIKNSVKVSKAPQFIDIAVNDLLSTEYNSKCEGTSLTVYGSNVNLKNVLKIKCPETIQVINIFSLNKFYFDRDVAYEQGIQINLVAPAWHVLGERSIVLFGKRGEQHSQIQAVGLQKKRGIDGLPGNPGKSGGSLIGVTSYIDGNENLKVSSRGGMGGDGQHGGRGADGLSLNVLKLPQCFHTIGKKTEQNKLVLNESPCNILQSCHDDLFNFNITADICEDIQEKKIEYYLVAGNNGTKGMDGGNGGEGGVGGKPGRVDIKLLSTANMTVEKHLLPGEGGEDGLGGEGGTGGYPQSMFIVHRRNSSGILLESDYLSKNDTSYYWDSQIIYFKEKLDNGNTGSSGANKALMMNHSATEVQLSPVQLFKTYRSTVAHIFQRKLVPKTIQNFMFDFYKSLQFSDSDITVEIFEQYLGNIDYNVVNTNKKFEHLLDYVRATNLTSSNGGNDISVSLLGFLFRYSTDLYVAMQSNVNSDLSQANLFSASIQDLVKNVAGEYFNIINAQMDSTNSFIVKRIKMKRKDIYLKTSENDNKMSNILIASANVKDRTENVVTLVMNDVVFHTIQDLLKLLQSLSALLKPIFDKFQPEFIGNSAADYNLLHSVESYLKTQKAMMSHITEQTLKILGPIKTDACSDYNLWIRKLNEQAEDSLRIHAVSSFLTLLTEFTNFECEHLLSNHPDVYEQVRSLIKTAQVSIHLASIYAEKTDEIQVLNQGIVGSSQILAQVESVKNVIYHNIDNIFHNIPSNLKEISDKKLQTQFSVVINSIDKLITEVNGFHLVFQLSTENIKVVSEANKLAKYIQGMYKHVRNYLNHKELLASITDVASSHGQRKLHQTVLYNIYQSKLNSFVTSLGQRLFPFADLLKPIELTKNVSQKQLDQEFKSKMQQVIDNFKKIDMNSEHASDVELREFNTTHPMYTWSNKTYSNQINKLLTGEEITLSASVYHILALDALKIKDIKVLLKTKDQDNLNKLMENISIKLTHLGTSYFKCSSNYFVVYSEPQNFNARYEDKEIDSEYLLSPYADWKLKLEPATNDLQISLLQEFLGKVELQIVGTGQYLKQSGYDVCFSKNYFLPVDKYLVETSLHENVENELFNMVL